NFIEEIDAAEGANLWVLFLGGIFPLLFYVFISDLNSVYEKIQNFFFRHQILQQLFPSVLILLIISYFIFPKLFRVSFNRDIFIFSGAAAFMVHLIYTSRQTKTSGFIGFMNYLFIFSLFYIIDLFFLLIYIKIGFSVDLGELFIKSVGDGSLVVKSIFLQLAP
ncbi:MAG: hypothetical protein ABH858_03265, partial [Candidatus Omnitrophota bacterium]